MGQLKTPPSRVKQVATAEKKRLYSYTWPVAGWKPEPGSASPKQTVASQSRPSLEKRVKA